MKIITFLLAFSLPFGGASVSAVSTGLAVTGMMIVLPAHEVFAGKKERRRHHRKNRRKHVGKAASKHRRAERRDRHRRHERRERRRESARQAVGLGAVMAARKYKPEYQR